MKCFVLKASEILSKCFDSKKKTTYSFQNSHFLSANARNNMQDPLSMADTALQFFSCFSNNNSDMCSNADIMLVKYVGTACVNIILKSDMNRLVATLGVSVS